MQIRRWLAAGTVLCATGGWALAQTTLPAAPPSTQLATAPTAAPALPDTELLLSRLSSGDWHERRKAQEQLVALGEAGKPFIEELVRRAQGEEARKNAQAALVLIDQNKLLGPSYITLHVKGAAPKEVFAELSRQCFATLATMPENLWDEDRFPKLTLDIDRKPFWEVMPRICEQLGVDLRPYNNGVRIMRTGGMQIQGIAKVDGPFLIVANQINYSRTRNFGRGGAEQTQFGMNLSVFPEPKIIVLRSSGSVKLDEAIDDHGRSLVPSSVGPRTFWGGSYYGGLSLYAPLQYPQKDPGTKIVRFKGSTSVLIQTKMQRMEIPDVMNLRETTRMISGAQVDFKEMKRNGDTYELHLRVGQANLGGPEWQQLMEGLQTRMQVVDAAGNPLDHRGMSSSGGNDGIDMTIHLGRSTGPDGRMTGEPARIVWDVPIETRELTIPIEFTDLPLFENR